MIIIMNQWFFMSIHYSERREKVSIVCFLIMYFYNAIEKGTSAIESIDDHFFFLFSLSLSHSFSLSTWLVFFFLIDQWRNSEEFQLTIFFFFCFLIYRFCYRWILIKTYIINECKYYLFVVIIEKRRLISFFSLNLAAFLDEEEEEKIRLYLNRTAVCIWVSPFTIW
jgi:hypothetical protein